MGIYTTILMIILLIIVVLIFIFTEDKYHYTGYYTPQMYDKHYKDCMKSEACMGWYVLMQAITEKGHTEIWDGLYWNCHTGILIDMEGNEYLVEAFHKGEPFSFTGKPSQILVIQFKISHKPTTKTLNHAI